MKYIDYAFKVVIVVLVSASLFYLVRLTSLVNQIGLMIYKDTRASNNISELPKPVGGNLFSGSDSAKVKITVFVDFQCPFCKQFFNQIVPKIEEKYVRHGLASVYTKYLPLSHIHPSSILFAKGAEYSKYNGVYRDYILKVFSQESEITPAILNEVLNSLKIDTLAFKESLMNEGFYTAINKDLIEAQGYGINGTPTIVINQKVILGIRDFGYFENIIEDELHNVPGSLCQ